MTITFASILNAYAFANSDAGLALIDAAYNDQVYIRGCHGGYTRLSSYRTPQAAALAALVNTEAEKLGNAFGITTLLSEGGDVSHAATLEHDGDYTHTDAKGFLEFLNDNDWQDEDWRQKIMD